MKVIGIQRDSCFSPNSVEKDRAILDAVIGRFDGTIIAESELRNEDLSQTDIIFNMGRLPETVALLKKKEFEGTLILNSGTGVERCRRSNLVRLMRENHIPQPPLCGTDGYWIKRGDASAQKKEDVRYCKNDEELAMARMDFAERGIKDIVVQAHIKGDLVKFYGVEGTGFFRTFYPGDDGESKFGDEAINGKPHRIFYEKQNLQACAEMLARMAETPIYGGDAIINSEGDFFIIDFNDWPSFSRCKDEAAEAIIFKVRMLQ